MQMIMFVINTDSALLERPRRTVRSIVRDNPAMLIDRPAARVSEKTMTLVSAPSNAPAYERNSHEEDCERWDGLY